MSNKLSFSSANKTSEVTDTRQVGDEEPEDEQSRYIKEQGPWIHVRRDHGPHLAVGSLRAD